MSCKSCDLKRIYKLFEEKKIQKLKAEREAREKAIEEAKQEIPEVVTVKTAPKRKKKEIETKEDE